ncbi:MAG: DUF2490 domain-containing protein [Pseudomonadota bacterium]
MLANQLAWLGTLLLMTAWSLAAAQDSESDVQAWNALAVAGPVASDSPLLFWFDGHARFRDDASELGVTIVRPALGWRAHANLDLWAGYARVVSRQDLGPNIKEDRAWQQATFPLPDVLGGSLSGRSRLEQRFRNTGDDTGWRFRQFIRWGKRIERTNFSVVVWDEVFVNLHHTDWGQREGFDQNRLFVGGAWHLGDKTRVEAGYLHNLLDTPGPDEQSNHNISLTFFCSL